MDRRQRRDLARRAVAPRRAGLHPLVLAAWLLAAVVCGVVLVRDEYFVVRYEGNLFDIRIGTVTTFGCFGWVQLLWRESSPVLLGHGLDREPTSRTESRTYAEVRASIRRGDPLADRMPDILDRLSRGGAALFAFACAAPALGLLAVLRKRASPGFRHVLLLLAALAPLVALEYFGRAVDAYDQAIREGGPFILEDTRVTLDATWTIWWARIAWGGLAGAAAASWWRWPKRRRVAPVDPEVFE